MRKAIKKAPDRTYDRWGTNDSEVPYRSGNCSRASDIYPHSVASFEGEVIEIQMTE